MVSRGSVPVLVPVLGLLLLALRSAIPVAEAANELASARESDTSLINPESSQSTRNSHTTVRMTTEIHSGHDRAHLKTSYLLNDVVSLSLIIICSVSGLFGLGVAGLFWYRLQKEVRRTQNAAYDWNKQPQPQPVDWKIVAKLQKHQYLHQKKALQAMEEGRSEVQKKQISTDWEMANGNGEYTVYECPGLAPAGEMEIYNPLFNASVLRAASSDREH
ncbi:neural proliferation differentiation and control protein 1-like isoform X2 [Chiloscyllium plagiosum]|uniref:neural proliferation differentiation and control protein 1-like isoform X2 n=1 Tax=Chiloscyllium plagiosum TaxID=36176 RepID=UPI001CB87527|nr:neural proliferation differentiation and control protein 1-like isoform X2 [Chiloscyllium plagiosum]